MSGRVLLADPDSAGREAIGAALRDRGLSVDETADGDVVLDRAMSGGFEVAILDPAVPGLHGLEGCRRIRHGSDVPILLLSEHDSELDRVLGLEAGADDFIGKPFSMAELVSRVRAILRRRELDARPSRPVLQVGDLEIDFAAHRVQVAGRRVSLTPMEFGLLSLLAEEPGRARTPQDILRHLWGSQHVGQLGACKTHVANLRVKIEDLPAKPQRIVTVRGRGYLLRAGQGILTSR
jgi:DNA-binding response OmpR family regulator